MPRKDDMSGVEVRTLVFAYQREQWILGSYVLVEDCLQETGAVVDESCLLDLLYHEMCLADELGVATSREEYLRRFPDVADEIENLWDIHEALVCQDLTQTFDGNSG